MAIKIEFDVGKFVEKLRNMLSKVGLAHILLLSLALHLMAISQPNDGGMIFDEAYYVPAAQKVLSLTSANAEQMPLTKIIIGIFIGIFGNYWFSWRVPIVITCIAAEYFFYRLAKKFLGEKYALFATAFLSFDIMFFVNGSIAILDMPAIMFGLWGLDLFFDKKFSRSGFAMALSVLCKITGFMFIMVIGFYLLFTHLRRPTLWKQRLTVPHFSSLKRNTQVLKQITLFVLLFLIVSAGGLQLYIWVFKPYSGENTMVSAQIIVLVDQNGNPINTTTRYTNMTIPIPITNVFDYLYFQVHYFSGLVPSVTTTASQLREPWGWILPWPNQNTFNPPVYYLVQSSNGIVTTPLIKWVSAITPTIEFFYVPVYLASIALIVLRRDNKDEQNKAIFTLIWMSITFFPWLYIGLIQQMTFNYYFGFCIPSIAFGIPYFFMNILKNEKLRDSLLFVDLVLTALLLLANFPIVWVR